MSRQPGHLSLPDALGLKVPVSAARDLLQQHVVAGEVLLARRPQDWTQLQQVIQDYQAWSGSNRDLLRTIFISDVPGLEYSAFHGPVATDDGDPTTRAARLRDDVLIKLDRLRALASRLARGIAPAPSTTASAPVLVAHEAPEPVLVEVSRFLLGLGVEVRETVTLALDDDAPQPAHALVLLTRPMSAPAALQLGFLLGALGRGAVTVLRAEGVALPPGVARVPDIVLDAGGAWKLLLARALRQSGVAVDVTRAASSA